VLNVSSGLAARNGLTSRTIPFGFTSTTGSLLIVVIYGAVTHTVTGWTEQFQPVASGELSVFTKTSDGDTGITVTHNGANYPVAWTAFEFGAGSTYLGGVSSNNGTTDAFPELAGLPATAKTIIAAGGRTASGAETGASSTWTGWVEDADQFAAVAAGTDGCYLTAAHQEGYTSTSITPTVATTYTGTWTTPDRQRIVIAVTDAGGTGSPGATPDGAAVPASTGSPAAAIPAAAPASVPVAVDVGSPTASLVTAQPAGMAVPVAVGTPTAELARTAGPAGLAIAATLGTPTADLPGSTPAGIAVPVTPGQPRVSTQITPDGVAVPASLGQPTADLARTAQPDGLTVPVTAGSPTAGPTVQGSRITPRPFAGVTTRPYTGTTARP
jgi:hypothetical protein